MNSERQRQDQNKADRSCKEFEQISQAASVRVAASAHDSILAWLQFQVKEVEQVGKNSQMLATGK